MGTVTEQFERPAQARPAAIDRDGAVVVSEEDGLMVDEYLLGQALRGLLAGPLALAFKDRPEEAGAFAARVVNGAHGCWYPAE